MQGFLRWLFSGLMHSFVFLVLLLPAFQYGEESGTGPSAGSPSIEEENNEERAREELELFQEIRDLILDNYVVELDGKDLLFDSLHGMADALPYSSFYPPREASQFREEISGKYVGLGVVCYRPKSANGALLVYKTRFESPASQLLKPGDEILSVDGIPTAEHSIKEVYDWMRGEGRKGTACRLKIRRPATSQILTVQLIRESISIPSVFGERIVDMERGIGYVRIEKFLKYTDAEFRHAMDTLETARGGSLDALILDLRFNAGGILNSALGVANAFLREGVLVSTRGRSPSSRKVYTADRNRCAWPELDLVILVNGQSASAAEVLAGALKDHRRAVLLGEPTFGKGVVQSALRKPLHDQSVVIKIPTALYYLPSGLCVEKRMDVGNKNPTGLRPDIVIPLDPRKRKLLRSRLYDLGFEHNVTQNETKGTDDETLTDVQLKAALQLLSGRTPFTPLPAVPRGARTGLSKDITD